MVEPVDSLLINYTRQITRNQNQPMCNCIPNYKLCRWLSKSPCTFDRSFVGGDVIGDGDQTGLTSVNLNGTDRSLLTEKM